MSGVGLDDRAPGGETNAFLVIYEVLAGIWGSDYSDEYLSEVATRVCEALDGLGQRQNSLVVDLPEPDRWTEDGDSSQPEWDLCCDTLTAWPQGVETDDEDGFVDLGDLDSLRVDALKKLAACAASERMAGEAAAERGGG